MIPVAFFDPPSIDVLMVKEQVSNAPYCKPKAHIATLPSISGSVLESNSIFCNVKTRHPRPTICNEPQVLSTITIPSVNEVHLITSLHSMV